MNVQTVCVWEISITARAAQLNRSLYLQKEEAPGKKSAQIKRCSRHPKCQYDEEKGEKYKTARGTSSADAFYMKTQYKIAPKSNKKGNEQTEYTG